MSQTAAFRRQHGELMRLAGQIRGRLDEARVRADPRTLRVMVARFAGLLRVHERMETEALYPALVSDADEQVRATAVRLRRELGPLYKIFDAYEQRWPTADALAADPAAFIESTEALFAALGQRMATENQELYPLVDARSEG